MIHPSDQGGADHGHDAGLDWLGQLRISSQQGEFGLIRVEAFVAGCLESLVTGSWFLHTARLVCFEIGEESRKGGLEAIVVLPFREIWDVIFSDNSSQIPSCIRIEALPFLD